MTAQEKLIIYKKQLIRSNILKNRQSNLIKEKELIKNLEDNFTQISNNARFIACFISMKNEINIYPFFKHLRYNNLKIVLPKITSSTSYLNFYLYSEGDELVLNSRYKFYEPLENNLKIVPDVIIVPMLAFDKFKNRLGYGGGFYDRTLSYYDKAVSVGIAFSNQYIDILPTNKFDIKMSYIFTENNVIR